MPASTGIILCRCLSRTKTAKANNMQNQTTIIDLHTALKKRQDQYALTLLKAHPQWGEEPQTARLALDYGCVRVIRYLRNHDLIGGSYHDRAAAELSALNEGLAAIEADLAELSKKF